MNTIETTVELNAELVATTIATNLPHLDVEICGSWAWIGGTTKADAKALKELALGLKWSPNKEKWYFAGSKPRSFGKKTQMEDIRAWHGSVKVS